MGKLDATTQNATAVRVDLAAPDAGGAVVNSGAYLYYYAWTTIVRHVPVPGRHSPDDPALAQYWADRRRKRKLPQSAES